MRSTLSTAAALLAGAAVAQAPLPPAPQPDLPPRYEVEVLVFAHRTFDPTEERFEFAPSSFDGDAAAPLREVPVFDDTNFDPRAEPLTAPQQPQPFTPVDPFVEQQTAALLVVPLLPSELKLGSEYRKLEALAAYEPLLHVGWVQPGLAESDATPFDLKTLGLTNPRGTIRVHLSRFLHITVDLTYQAGAAEAPALGAGDGLDEISVAPQYRLQATRSARSNELHYFDHPVFGVLVRVTPVPAQDGSGRRPAA